jgi:hypothetical protein
MEEFADRYGLTIALILAIGAVLMFARPCAAQEAPSIDVTAPCAPEVSANRRAVLEHEGDGGVWFHMDVASCMLGRLSALPEYATYVRLLEERLSLSDRRDELRVFQVELAEKEAQTAAEALETAVRGRREAEESLGAWHRSRVLWFTVGVVATGLLVGLSAYAFNRLGGS